MPEPTKIPRPFADSGDKNSIPDSSGGLGFASWQEGFPAITGTPFAQGGVAPKRADFNGIFNALSLATVWNQQGGVYAYDATTDYEVGNIVEYSGDLYKCITANGPSSAVKDPTDTTVWDAIATASGYFPRSGGTLTGDLTLSKNNFSYIYNANVNYGLGLYGGLDYDQGASIVVFGKTATNNSGFFCVRAHNGSVGKDLIGKPDGTLTWGGKDVATIQTGTWTPVICGATTAGTYTGSTYGTYYKIGNLVYIVGGTAITWSTSPNGQARLTGLPYTVKNSNTGIYLAGTGTSPGATRISDAVCIQDQTYAVLRARNVSGSTADVSSFASSESGFHIVGQTGKTMSLTITGCYLTA